MRISEMLSFDRFRNSTFMKQVRVINNLKNQKRLKKMASFSKGRILDVGFNKDPNQYAAIDVGIDIRIDKKPENYKEVYIANAENFTKNKFIKGKFDTIIAGELIEHLENPSAFLRECYKALNPNGVLLISTPTPYYMPYALCEIFMFDEWFYTDAHLNTLPPRVVLTLLKRNNFKCKKIIGSKVFNYNLIYVCSRVKK